MLSLPELVQIHFCMQPTDMRKGFDSLAALVRDHLGCDPLSSLPYWMAQISMQQHIPKNRQERRNNYIVRFAGERSYRMEGNRSNRRMAPPFLVTPYSPAFRVMRRSIKHYRRHWQFTVT